MRILFVCLGNICRSPLAEGLMRKYAAEAGIPLTVDSAATSQLQIGKSPHPGTQEILAIHEVDDSGMFARQIETKDFEEYDYIIGMDRQNVFDLLQVAPEKYKDKVHLFLSISPEKEVQDIPDPWYTGDFDETHQMIHEGLVKWLAYLGKQK